MTRDRTDRTPNMPGGMVLTPDQEDLLAGGSGEDLALAMRTVVRYGEMLGSRRLAPIRSAHLVGSFGIVIFRTFYRRLRRFADAGLKVRVPTTVNPRPGVDHAWINRLVFLRQRGLESGLARLGVIPTFSCTFYEVANRPQRGDVLAWGESSAVVYANTVLGARTNCNALGIDLCSALTGYTPDQGLLIDENRRGRVLVRLRVDRMDASALGYHLGQSTGNRIPVIEHHPFTPSELRSLGAGMASSSRIGMFHVEGVTPEAPDLETACGGAWEETLTVTQDDLDRYRSRDLEGVDLVVFGCPQLTLPELEALAERFRGGRLQRPTMCCAGPGVLERFRDTPGHRHMIEAGVELRSFCPLAALSTRASSRRVLSPSTKLFQYMKNTGYAPTEDCLRAAGVDP